MIPIKDNIYSVAENIVCPIEISTGFPALDDLTRGLHRKELTILAGRSSMGKTALMLDLALHTSESVPTGIFSLEMSGNQLIERSIANKQSVSYKELKEGKIRVNDGVIAYLTTLNLGISDSSGLSVVHIAKEIDELKEKPHIIFVDYLQLIRSFGRGARYEEVDKITQSLREIAKNYNIAVVLLCQLNREVERRDNHRPRLSDLRESGGIEQIADTIIFIYRPSYYQLFEESKTETADTGEAHLIVAKQRNGPLGDIPVVFMNEQMSFKPINWETF